VTVTGFCDGQLSASGPESAAQAAAGSWRISGTGVSANGLHSGQLELPQIGLGRVESTGTWQGPRLTIESLRTVGPLGSTSLAGRVVLRAPVEQSALNLRLTHSPAAAGSADLSGMLRLLLPGGSAGGGGPRTFHVGGTLGLPAIRPEN
jgi:type II secretion system protein N